ncbi:hypothetical protein Esi_1226_0001 [Ectocarpus siliculosus]|uniref:Uncharacterized protein n=1 Tax=Ectocarpus siliculosus TaxID=2880 RepID=D7FIQ9_ECTSI|nr:hypothetical protein Esi_1226_0001 [Ectocarpus siliculosus]|eukprot:CBJ34174.1 hypothetical protein Esi_1226_0001 [Ectocarpus siliculosus]
MSILMDGALPGRHGGSSAGGQEALWEEAGEGDEELPSGDVEAVRELVEEATTKGFRSATIDEAANDVAKQDQQKKVFAFFRSLPCAVVDHVTSTSLDIAERSTVQHLAHHMLH